MSEQSPQRVWFITGASTGFGKVLTEKLAAQGQKVVATARKPEQITTSGENVLTAALDVTRQDTVDAAVQAAIAKFERIDVLVNNAGYGLVGAIEEPSEAEIAQVFETNVFGLLRVTRAVLPHMRAQKSGHILNLSSIGGLIATPGLGYYNATKFAVEGLSEALRGECEPLGIKVTVVEPGPFRTDFLGRSGAISERVIEDYVPTAGKARQYFSDNDGKQAGDPNRAIAAMIAAVEAPEAPRHLLLGKSAHDRMTARIAQWQKDLEAGRETAINADFPTP
jgi:NADP-dependent 3-hydroxy acid dehydrogenase YdfG